MSEITWQKIGTCRTTTSKDKTLANVHAAIPFSLGWMQCPQTQAQSQLWADLFTDETPASLQSIVKKYNSHLNEPVRQGEIVVLPTAEPVTEDQQSLFDELINEAKYASEALAKLAEEEVATLNRHFELLDYAMSEAYNKTSQFASNTWESVQPGMPTDNYAYGSLGVGAVASGVERHLKNIRGVISEINALYVQQVAMASRTGGINYGTFVSERAELFKKLDDSFARLSKRSVQLPIYKQVKRNLRLSTKSVVHNAEHILSKKGAGYVPKLGKRIAHLTHGISGTKAVGNVALVLSAASAGKNIYDACNVNSNGNCAKATTVEGLGFIGGWFGGSIGGDLAFAGTMLLLGVVGVTAAPIIAVAGITSFVAGGAIGGILGSSGGKYVGDVIYEIKVNN